MKVIVLQPKLSTYYLLDLMGVGSSIHQPLSQICPAYFATQQCTLSSARSCHDYRWMVVIVQSIEYRAATVLTLNAEETFHAIHIQSPSLLMIFSRDRYTELNYSVSFGKE